MLDWRTLGAVAVGGGLGSVARYVLSVIVTQRFGWAGFPYATLFINVTGSLLIGIVAGFALRDAFSTNQTLRIFLAFGILGGYTTFSTFSLEAFQLARTAPALSLLYVLLSVALGIAAAYAGFSLVRPAA
jgi:CrcB protein